MAGIFDTKYYVTSFSIFSEASMEGHLDLANKVFGYLNKYSKRGYTINNQPLNISMDDEKVDLRMDFGNQYSYFQ